MTNYWSTRSKLLPISVAIFVVAMPFDAFCQGGCSHWQSWGILLFGWLGAGLANLTWLANPLIFLSWGMLLFPFEGRRTAPAVVAVMAFFTAASFLLFDEVSTNEGGVPSPITGYSAGYWIWLTSMEVCACCAFEKNKTVSGWVDKGRPASASQS